MLYMMYYILDIKYGKSLILHNTDSNTLLLQTTTTSDYNAIT